MKRTKDFVINLQLFAGTFGHGTILKLNSVTVSEVVSVSGPNMSADAIDVTTHDSDDNYREFIQGLRDGGEITVEGNLATTTDTEVYDIFNTTSVVSCTVNMPTSPSRTQWAANVIVTAFGTEAPNDNQLPYSATFKVTGKPSFSQI